MHGIILLTNIWATLAVAQNDNVTRNDNDGQNDNDARNNDVNRAGTDRACLFRNINIVKTGGKTVVGVALCGYPSLILNIFKSNFILQVNKSRWNTSALQVVGLYLPAS